MNLEQKKFEEWKRRHGKLDEGFLDGNDDLETADVPSEDVSSEEEKDLSEEPSEEPSLTQMISISWIVCVIKLFKHFSK